MTMMTTTPQDIAGMYEKALARVASRDATIVHLNIKLNMFIEAINKQAEELESLRNELDDFDETIMP